MKWFILLVGLLVICFVAALVLGLIGGGMGRATSSLHHDPLPDTPLTDDDLDGLRFDVTARGYRMSEVDAVIARLQRELREKDEQIAVLAGGALGRAPGDATPEATAEDVAAGEPADEAVESSSAPEAVPEPAPQAVPEAAPEAVPERVSASGLAPTSASGPAPEEEGAAVPAARDGGTGSRDA